MKNVTYVVVLFFMGVFLQSCSYTKTEKDKIDVIVSIPPEAFIVKAIAADLVNINCVMENGNNPESFEPSVNQIHKLSQSDIYFAMIERL